MKKNILVVFGTRPEAIKMAPVIREFFRYPDYFNTKVCVTAQHREMLDQVLDFFEIIPDFDLDLMKPKQNLFNLTSEIILGIKSVLEVFDADYVFVHGDTTTSMASALAAYYSGKKVCHVEAGLRTYDKISPFPEEINRQLTARISDYHFAPTKNSKKNLLNENIPEESVFITGNTVIDALLVSVRKVNENPSKYIRHISNKLGDRDVILVTGHRRENFGQGFINICQALKEIAQKHSDIMIVYPVHLNPKVQDPVKNILSNVDNILLVNPMEYKDFVWMMNRSKIIISDSGGVQEEAPSLGKPVLLIRNTTERPEAVDAGTVLLVGTDRKKIVKETTELLENNIKFSLMSKLHNPYGDGLAAKKIVKIIKDL